MVKKSNVIVSCLIFLLVLGCENVVRPEGGKSGIPAGMGQVRLLLPVVQGGRTLAPSEPNFSKFEVFYQLKTGDNWGIWTAVTEQSASSSNPGERSVFLTAGTYKLRVDGFAGASPDEVRVARGETGEIALEADKEVSITVNLSPVKDNGNGTFTWSVTMPSDAKVKNAGFKFYDSAAIPNLYSAVPPAPIGLIIFKSDNRFLDWLHYQGNRPDGNARDPIGTDVFVAKDSVTVDGMTTYSGSASLPAGNYFVTLTLHGYDYASGASETGTRIIGHSEIVGVYSKLETPMAYTFGDDAFPRMVTLSGSTSFTVNAEPTSPTIRLYKKLPDGTRQQIDEFATVGTSGTFNRSIQAATGDLLEFDAVVQYQNSVFTKTLNRTWPLPSGTTLAITAENTIDGIVLADALNLNTVQGTADVIYAGIEESMNLYYVNLQVYEDAQRQKLLNFGALVKPGNPDVYASSIINGTFSLLLPTNSANYYVTVQADFGLEGSANAIKLTKDIGPIAMQGGKLNLGRILFEGFDATISGTLTGILSDIVTNSNWKNQVKTPAISVYRDANRSGKQLGTKAVSSASWDVQASVPTYTENLYLLFEFKAGTGANEATYRLPVGDMQPPANKSGIALSMDVVEQTAAGTGNTVRGTISIANTGQAVAYKPLSTGNYIVYAAAGSGTSLAPTVAVYSQNGALTAAGANLDRFTLTEGQTYLVLVKGGAGKVGAYDLSIAPAPATGGSGLLQLETTQDIQRAIDELFIATYVREYGDEADEALRVEFNPAYSLSDFFNFAKGDNFDYSIDANPLGSYTQKPDTNGSLPEHYEYSPYRGDPAVGVATVTLSYDNREPGSIHILSLRVIKDGIAYNRNWQVKIPVTQ